MADSSTKAHRVPIGEEFYRYLKIRDDKLLENIELAVELYTGKHDTKGQSSEAAANFERAIGIFTTSYVRTALEIFKQHELGLSPEQKVFLNFGVLDARTISNPMILDEIGSEIYRKTEYRHYEINYMYNWLEKVARGSIPPTSDTAQIKQKSVSEETLKKRREKRTKLEIEVGLLRKEEIDRAQEMKTLASVYPIDGNIADKSKIIKILKDKVLRLEAVIREQGVRLEEIETILALEKGIENSPELGAQKFNRIKEEFEMLSQIMKSCAVRGGLIRNTPVLLDKFIPMDSRLKINNREAVAKHLAEFEAIDHTIFIDKNGKRTPPKVLIMPGVGTGMAWKDRIMISIFPPANLAQDVAIVKVLAGFRWYLATDSYSWKDLPGELGSMYQVIYPDKTFNNLEKQFIDDYTNWMIKEAQGYQILNPEVRKLFWKKIPFSKELKEKLSRRATVYAQLLVADKKST